MTTKDHLEPVVLGHVRLVGGMPTELHLPPELRIPGTSSFAPVETMLAELENKHGFWMDRNSVTSARHLSSAVIPIRPNAIQPTHRVTFEGSTPWVRRVWLLHQDDQGDAYERKLGQLVRAPWQCHAGEWQYLQHATPYGWDGNVTIEPLAPLVQRI